MPVFKYATNPVPNLEAEFDRVDLLPQDLVSAYILRECSESRDVELREVD